MVDVTQLPLLQEVGPWLGFVVSLLIFSLLVGENALARTALHLLIGTSLGYAALLAWQAVLRPLLLEPLSADLSANLLLLIPLVLGMMMVVAGLERIFLPQRRPQREGRWRRAAGLTGALPAALLIGLSLATITFGSIQGTLAPQSLRAAATGIPWSKGIVDLAMGIVMLLITTGALLQLRVKPERDLGGQSRWVSNLLAAWMAIGRSGLWLLAGVLFARLLASRFSLLIARLGALAAQVQDAGLWGGPR